MKIKDFKVKDWDYQVRKTRIIDGDKEFVIHTDVLNDSLGLDMIFQGFDTTGLIETLIEQVKPERAWLNNTKFQTANKETALSFHQFLIDFYKKHRHFNKDFTNFETTGKSLADRIGFWERQKITVGKNE